MLLVLLTFLSWAGAKTLVKFIERIEAELSKLSIADWGFLARSLPVVAYAAHARRRDRIAIDRLPKNLKERTVFAISSKCTPDDARKLYLQFLRTYSGGDPFISSLCLRTALELIETKPELWNHLLLLLNGYEPSGSIRDPYHVFRGTGSISQSMPLEVARRMAAEPNNYPRAWVFAATERCELDAASSVEAVGVVAQREGWFKRQ